jgi:glucuronokinase
MSSVSFSYSVPARAALAGNPSDGHGGAVVATVVPSLAATVSVSPSSHFCFDGFSDQFEAAGNVSNWLDRGQFGGPQPLLAAALTVLHRRFDADLRTHTFQLSTTIPRSLGLAGSSAIVIAALRAMIATHQDHAWAQELVGRPELIASLALEAERDILGIAAGLQDRVVQTLGGTVAMEFGGEYMHTVDGLHVGSYRPLGPLPAGFFVAYRDGTASDSGLVHRAADVSGDGFRHAMMRSADAARAAAEAIECADVGALGAAMDATFDERAIVFPLDPAHVEMVDVARSNGASANYTGSGGSIIVLAPDPRAAVALGNLGCTIVSL